MSLAEKNRYLRLYSKYFYRTSTEIDVFIAILTKQKLFYIMLQIQFQPFIPQIFHHVFYMDIFYFLPIFYHGKRDKNFLKVLKFIEEREIIDKVNLSKFPAEVGKKLYEYQRNPAHNRNTSLKTSDIDCLMPDTYFKSVGLIVSGISFLFPSN